MTPSITQEIPEHRRRNLARLRLGNVRSYLADLEAHARGDAGRFLRMVDNAGRQIVTPELWRSFVAHWLADPDIRAYCQATDYQRVASRAQALGIEPEEDPPGGRHE